ncbi:hypothetical protein [Trinickia dinghuensis]|uniref:Uncharacterized protein n=1 Tax=Trinickia dinghuensis TaxID=2291023 RepID=A0A3D8K2J7_9BURK|nr:hypothetical protein [Trinickia dinghuensis]RDU98791.1 hypothetical protein DWV00_11020 [Trinickia dinghuensis]
MSDTQTLAKLAQVIGAQLTAQQLAYAQLVKQLEEKGVLSADEVAKNLELSAAMIPSETLNADGLEKALYQIAGMVRAATAKPASPDSQ